MKASIKRWTFTRVLAKNHLGGNIKIVTKLRETTTTEFVVSHHGKIFTIPALKWVSKESVEQTVTFKPSTSK